VKRRAAAGAFAGACLLLGCAQPSGSRAPDSAAATPALLAVDVYGGSVPAPGATAPPAVAFRVLAAEDDAEAGRVVATGRTGGAPSRCPPAS
jgi:hypothetical protein